MFGAILELGRAVAVYFNVCAIIIVQGGIVTVPLIKSDPSENPCRKLESLSNSDLPNSDMADRPDQANGPTAAIETSKPADAISQTEIYRTGVDDLGDCENPAEGDGQSDSGSQLVFLLDRVVKPSDSTPRHFTGKIVGVPARSWESHLTEYSANGMDASVHAVFHRMVANAVPPANGPPQFQNC